MVLNIVSSDEIIRTIPIPIPTKTLTRTKIVWGSLDIYIHIGRVFCCMMVCTVICMRGIHLYSSSGWEIDLFNDTKKIYLIKPNIKKKPPKQQKNPISCMLTYFVFYNVSIVYNKNKIWTKSLNKYVPLKKPYVKYFPSFISADGGSLQRMSGWVGNTRSLDNIFSFFAHVNFNDIVSFSCNNCAGAGVIASTRPCPDLNLKTIVVIIIHFDVR